VAKLVYPAVPKSFNTSGPCLPDRHPMLPPLPRMSEAQALVELGRYFVLRAPRRSGVTTSLLAFARALTASGSYAAIYASCETAEASSWTHSPPGAWRPSSGSSAPATAIGQDTRPGR